MRFSDLPKALCVIFVSSEPVTAQGLSEDLGWSAKAEIWRHSRLQALREEQSAALVPFATDGCSGGMSAAWGAMARTFPWFARVFEHEAPWHNCCVVHDQAYHLGGETADAEAGFFQKLISSRAENIPNKEPSSYWYKNSSFVLGCCVHVWCFCFLCFNTSTTM